MADSSDKGLEQLLALTKIKQAGYQCISPNGAIIALEHRDGFQASPPR